MKPYKLKEKNILVHDWLPHSVHEHFHEYVHKHVQVHKHEK